MNKICVFFCLFFISHISYGQDNHAQDTTKPKKIAIAKNTDKSDEAELANRLKPTPPKQAFKKRMESSFHDLEDTRVVKKKIPVPRNAAKSAHDPNALSIGNFKISPNLYQEHAKYIFDYVNNYHKNHGARMTRIKSRNKSNFSMIDKTLRKNKIPVEFHSLAVIESALNPLACSPVGAMGPWQFMAPTAEDLGLKVTDSLDERTDFIKSTWAAAKYCKRLHNIFHDWLLVVASYNCGPAPVLRAQKKTGQKSFWDIRTHLPKETQNHVMAFIATSVWYDKNTKVLDMGGLPSNSKPADYDPSEGKDTKPKDLPITKKPIPQRVTTSTPQYSKPPVQNNKLEKDEEIALEETNNAKTNPNAPRFIGDEGKDAVTLKIKGQYNLQAISDYLNTDLDQLIRWNPNFNEIAYANKETLLLTIPEVKLEAFLLQKDKILRASMNNPFVKTPSVRMPKVK